MNQENDKWMEDVFQSMQGSKRAKPGPDLFSKIEEKISASDVKVIPMYQRRIAVAAAALIVLVNAAALHHYNQSEEVYEEVVAADTYSQPIISTYQIY